MLRRRYKQVCIFTGIFSISGIIATYFIGTQVLLSNGIDKVRNYGENVQWTISSINPAEHNEINFRQINDSTTLAEIHEIIWSQIQSLQEEGDCTTKKILHCENIDNIAGYGSMLHRYGVCMQIAYGLGRIFFIEQREFDWNKGLFRYLQPESIKCGHLKGAYKNERSKCNLHDKNCFFNSYEIDNSYKVLVYNSQNRFPAPRRIPGTLPKIIKKHLIRLNIPNPAFWFTSRFLAYLLLRVNREFEQKFMQVKKQIGFKYPTVALHIRRTDKISEGESKYIDTEFFLNATKKYYHTIKTYANIKNVYVASDDVNIENELNTVLSKDYRLLMLPKLSRDAGKSEADRHTFKTYQSFLLDLHFLVYSNYTICTFSSNIGRLVYFLREALPPYNSSKSTKSLDDSIFYLWWGYDSLTNFNTAIRSNKKTIENMLPYKVGDRLNLIECNTLPPKPALFCAKKRNVEGYIFQKDIMKWPGTPTYYFF